MVIFGPVSFYKEQDIKIIEGPITLSKNSIFSETSKKYTRKELEKLSFAELREIGRKFRVKGRSKEGLIEDILAAQEGRKEPEI